MIGYDIVPHFICILFLLQFRPFIPKLPNTGKLRPLIFLHTDVSDLGLAALLDVTVL